MIHKHRPTISTLTTMIARYPYFHVNSGILTKFMPYQPTAGDSGRRSGRCSTASSCRSSLKLLFRLRAIFCNELRRKAQEQCAGHDAGGSVTEGFGREDSGCRKQYGKQEDPRCKNAFAEQGAEQRQMDVSQSSGHIRSHPLWGHKQCSRRINFNIPHTAGQNFPVS